MNIKPILIVLCIASMSSASLQFGTTVYAKSTSKQIEINSVEEQIDVITLPIEYESNSKQFYNSKQFNNNNVFNGFKGFKGFKGFNEKDELFTDKANTEPWLTENLLDEQAMEEIENLIDEITEGNDAAIATESEHITETDLAVVTQNNYSFDNGDFYWIKRYEFQKTTSDTYVSSFAIAGNEISIRYADYSGESPVWVETSDITNIKNEILYIQTDLYSIVVSPAQVYSTDTEHETLEAKPVYEVAPVITKSGDGRYTITFRFPQNEKVFAEVWAMQSKEPLIDWSLNQNLLMTEAFMKKYRWSMDGFYMKTYTSYSPYTANTYFRQTSNYGAASLLKSGQSRFASNMAYAMLKTSLKNINEYGYYATGSKSDWLYTDFGIGYGFYDTRFNTDFARLLLLAYEQYKDRDFLRASLMYTRFFQDFTNNYKYVVESADGDPEKIGWLTPDYTFPEEHKKAHVSLNHAVAEINFLLEQYLLTGDTGSLTYAQLLLQGIKNTRDMWVADNYNLNYAVFYTGKGTLTEYETLTYYDLVYCQYMLNSVYGYRDDDLQYLIDNKKIWMNNNSVEYKY